MAKPSLTYGHGLRADDGIDLADWTGYAQGNIADTSLTVKNGVITIAGKCTDGNHEAVYYENDFTNLNPSIYKYWMLMWKTEVGSNGLGARATLTYTDATEQELLGSTPLFSSTWQFVSGETLSDHGDLDKILLWADDYPDSVATGPHEVYFKFFLLYEDTFTFPYVSDKVEIESSIRFVDIPIPGRVGDLSQNLGAESEFIRIRGNMELDDWGTPKGNVLYKIIHDCACGTEPWQWFSCDEPKRNYRVTIRRFNPFWQGGSDGKPSYVVELKEYRASDASNESYTERFGYT